MDIYSLSISEHDYSGYGTHTDDLTKKVTNCQDPKNHYFDQKVDICFELTGVILHIWAIYFAIRSKNTISTNPEYFKNGKNLKRYKTSCISNQTK